MNIYNIWRNEMILIKYTSIFFVFIVTFLIGYLISKKYSNIVNTTTMDKSAKILLLDRDKIIVKNGEQYIKEIYFTFIVHDDEWNRYFGTGRLRLKSQARNDTTIFKYNSFTYKTDIIRPSTECLVANAFGACGYGY